MTDEIRKMIIHLRSELSDEERDLGFDYDFFIANNCIFAALYSPDGTIVELVFLERLDGYSDA